MPVNLGKPWHPEHPTNQKVDILPGTTSPSTCKVFDKIFTLLMSCLAKLAREEHLQNAGVLLVTNHVYQKSKALSRSTYPAQRHIDLKISQMV